MNKYGLAQFIKRFALVTYPDKPFTLSSGISSNVYIDKFAFLTCNNEFKACVEQLLEIIEPKEFDAIGGIDLGGSLLARDLSLRLSKQWFFTRKEPKAHGLCKQVEGGLDWIEDFYNEEEKPVRFLLVDDIITTGGSVLGAIRGIESLMVKLHSTKEDTCAAAVVRVVCIVERDDMLNRIAMLKADLRSKNISFGSVFRTSDL
jgi:orotate phosphoribosyltransferase